MDLQQAKIQSFHVKLKKHESLEKTSWRNNSQKTNKADRLLILQKNMKRKNNSKYKT